MQILTLIISALALMLTMLSILMQSSPLDTYENEFTLTLASTLVTITITAYASLSIKRITPKKYIYLSYSSNDKEIAEKTSSILSEQFKKLSKYRFEIISANSIPFGNDMYTTMQENMSKSDIVILIVSSSYLRSEWCRKEFESIYNNDKKIIPIVTESFSDLKKLPKDISNIKALSLMDCKLDDDFYNTMSILAKDLIKQRKD